MKKSVIIIGGIVVGLALLAYHGYDKVTEFADSLRVRVKGFRIPSLQSGIATVPLTLEVQNPVNIGVKLKTLNINIKLKQADGSYKSVGTASTGQIEIPPTSIRDISISPELNLNNINPFEGRSITDIFNSILENNPLLTFLVEWSGIYADSVAGNIPFSGSEQHQITVPT